MQGHSGTALVNQQGLWEAGFVVTSEVTLGYREKMQLACLNHFMGW